MLTTSEHPPLIVIGMHRSGTSVLSKALDELSIYSGSRLDKNNESTFFLRLNQWVLKELGGSWDNPNSVSPLLSDERLCDIYKHVLCAELNGIRSMEYLGLLGYMRNRSVFNLNSAWSWKDPRNAYTLPLWLKIFPNAKVLHITRDGRDVARSVLERREKRITYLTERYQGWLTTKRLRYRGFGDTAAIDTVNLAIDLWYKYESQANSYQTELGDNYLNIKYEILMDDPKPILERILSFYSSDASEIDVERTSKIFDKTLSGSSKNLDLSLIDTTSLEKLGTFGY